jgi:hypothetical protein
MARAIAPEQSWLEFTNFLMLASQPMLMECIRLCELEQQVMCGLLVAPSVIYIAHADSTCYITFSESDLSFFQ